MKTPWFYEKKSPSGSFRQQAVMAVMAVMFFLLVAGFAGLLLILVDAVLLPLSLAWDVGIEPTDNVVGPIPTPIWE